MMNRRELLKSAAVLSAVSVVPFNSIIGKTLLKKDSITPLKPPRLKKGDLVGLTVPGSSINEEELQDSVKNLENLGFKVFYTDRILAKAGFLGGTDKQRADDLNEMFANKEVKGIFCARGGYGSNRLAELINYDLVKKNPKVVCGYSDITALIYLLYSKTGLIAFHGPVATSSFNEFSVNHFVNTLMEPKDTYTMHCANDEDMKKVAYQRYALNLGKAEGELAGGNLTIVNSFIGTPYDIDLDGKILFIEEVQEEPYRIDRMLTQLVQSGKLDKVKGIAMGVFSGCEEKEDDPSFKDSFTLREVITDRLSKLNVPIIYGLSFGHIVNKFTLPVGIKAQLDTEAQTLTFLEPAVL